MKLGKVIGVVWASRKVKELNGCRLSVVQPVSTKGENIGNPLANLLTSEKYDIRPDAFTADGEGYMHGEAISFDATTNLWKKYLPATTLMPYVPSMWKFPKSTRPWKCSSIPWIP